jgi:hypothetical protein
MAWDYAELSKMAKANGGPEKLMDILINSGKRVLLLADEQEDMIDKYLERGEMFVLENDGVKGECLSEQEMSLQHLVFIRNVDL